MKISEAIRQSIIEDFDFALSKMKATEDKGELLFYFSAFYGAVNRALNFEYDQDLVFAHLVLKNTHETMFGRYKAITVGNDHNVPLFEDQFLSLVKLSTDFRDKIASSKSADAVLKKMAVLSYSTTGNGYYLFSKGWIKI